MTISDREHESEHGSTHEKEGNLEASGLGDAAGLASGAVVPPPAIADHELPGEDSDGPAGSGIV